MNANGSEKLRPFIIGNAQKPHAFQKKSGSELGFYYHSNAKAWMTIKLYQEWLLDWDSNLWRQQWHILLLQDNFSGHAPSKDSGLTNIHIKNFAPNLTAHIQPADACIIWCFKAHYCSGFINRAIDCYESNVPVAFIYNINQLEAMQLAEVAWDDISSETIQNCWLKAGILPKNLSTTLPDPFVPISSLLNPTDVNPVASAEKEVLESLAQLESTGVLKRANRMDLGQLMNPQMENELIDDVFYSDVEIFEACQGALQIEDGDRDSVDDDSALEKLSCAAALEASFMLQRFLSDSDNQFSHQLHGILTKFGHQIHVEQAHRLQDTSITDYFF